MTLADTLIPLFAQVRAFSRSPMGDAASLTAQLDGAIAAARLRAHDASFSQTDIDEALFAFNAWADELLLTTRWDGAAQWQRHLLQRRYSNVSNAGVVFYERLAQLTPSQLAVREVFYLCLALGFGGRYAYDRNQKTLTDIRRTNLAMLLPDAEQLGASARAFLFPDGYHVAGDDAAARKPTARARFATRLTRGKVTAILLPLFLLALLYGVYHTVVAQSVDTLLAQIHL
ncbi:DotU family type IV/VI secretion system protein [Caballeronia novacaledonica]|uniref:DotU family type IV/VI secretion system protein n=1 Tax=Caballeronia novacaledonica TaxID=1544861 RepID=A0AA37IE54_9BURK|nr:DotU family type IV/VI secretion system protein [Caballeronia novacaledonica]GJH24605.1 DotU family type IV/VI secretion system protein [Caballeronia novacaledonica]